MRFASLRVVELFDAGEFFALDRDRDFPADVIEFYQQHTRMFAIFEEARPVARFAWSDYPNLRIFSLYSQEQADELRRQVDLSDSFEVVGMWIVPRYRGTLKAILLWTMLFTTVFTKTRSAVLVSAAVEPGICRLYESAGNKRCYSAPITYSDGRTVPLVVYATPRKSIPFRLMYWITRAVVPKQLRRLLGRLLTRTRIPNRSLTNWYTSFTSW